MQIGRLLMLRSAIAEADLDAALAEQRSPRGAGQRLGSLLVRRGVVSEATLYSVLAEQLGLPLWDRNAAPDAVQRATLQREQGHALPEPLARRWDSFVSLADDGTSLDVVSRDPLAAELREHLRLQYPHCTLRWTLASSQDMQAALASIYRPGQESISSAATSDLRQLAQDAPIVELVASMLARGTDHSASDIHLEPDENGFTVRYRIDGSLRHGEVHPRSRFDAVVSRIKLVSGLDIAERRLPQDGRFSTRAAGIDTEVRVSVIPGVHGESIVMRLLPKTAQRRFKLEALGLESDHLELLKKWLQAPDGIVLVTGPTGSGKSTTLYAALAASDTNKSRVLTVEDPVEYRLPGVTQFQVQSEIGFTFPAALRAILRHDPDTIMVGEIRDAETAHIAIQASLTGHMVLSTLHTNDAASAFVRLIDIGVEPFLLAASVRGVIAQRLVRRLCTVCAKADAPKDIPVLLMKAASADGLEIENFAGRHAVGCPACSGSGYKGRTAVHEFLGVTPELRLLLSGGSVSPRSLRELASTNFRPLQRDALRRYWRGETSLAEVLSLPAPDGDSLDDPPS